MGKLTQHLAIRQSKIQQGGRPDFLHSGSAACSVPLPSTGATTDLTQQLWTPISTIIRASKVIRPSPQSHWVGLAGCSPSRCTRTLAAAWRPKYRIAQQERLDLEAMEEAKHCRSSCVWYPCCTGGRAGSPLLQSRCITAPPSVEGLLCPNVTAFKRAQMLLGALIGLGSRSQT